MVDIATKEKTMSAVKIISKKVLFLYMMNSYESVLNH